METFAEPHTGSQASNNSGQKDRPTTGRTVIGASTEGTKILNGKSRQVGPGDMVIIPPDTPHTFTEITTDRIVYMVVRVDPHKILQAD